MEKRTPLPSRTFRTPSATCWTNLTCQSLFCSAALFLFALPQSHAAVPKPQDKPVLKVEVFKISDTVPVPKLRPIADPNSLLSAANAELYRRIFALQAKGDLKGADLYTAQLTDLRLRGHVLHQRYMHPLTYRASFDELAGWLALYRDHPDAAQVYKLALVRMPKTYSGILTKPLKQTGIRGTMSDLSQKGKTYRSTVHRTAAQYRAVLDLQKAIRRDLSNTAPTAALNRLQSNPAARRYMDKIEYARLEARIAASYWRAGKIERAHKLVVPAFKVAKEKSPQAAWVMGMTFWRGGQYANSAKAFEVAANSPYAGNWMKSAAAYWASRAYLRARDYTKVSERLKQAAQYERTFYGIVALRALGQSPDMNWDAPTYNDLHQKRLMRVPGGMRSVLLNQIGQHARAEEELKYIHPGQDNYLREAMLAFAIHKGLPAFAYRYGNAYQTKDGKFYDAALYPLGPWMHESWVRQNAHGEFVDIALIHAIIRQESRFDTQAKNFSGATGLMQVMPATASYVAGTRSFQDRQGLYDLENPLVNIDIGRRYINNLLEHPAVDGDLLKLAIAYNAGPGNLSRWLKEYAHLKDDPLLFIEHIPVAETRDFVEKILHNYWIYQMRLGHPTPTLDAVASGFPAQYAGRSN